ncbi:DUF167 domain-containing protein [Chloroflexota bacterium]
MNEGQAKIVVQVWPNASQNKVTRFKNGVWYLRIAAPPVKGEANQELIRFFSNILGVGKGSLTIEKGMTSKKKIIVINGLTQSQVMGQLEKLAK